MTIRPVHGTRRLGLTASAVFALGLATAGPAAAASSVPSTTPSEPAIGSVGAAGSATVSNQTLFINGTSGQDRIALRLATGDPTTVQVDFGDNGSSDQSFSRASFSQVSVTLGAGDDEFRVDAAFDTPVIVNGGSGDDTITGGAGNDILLGGAGNDTISGGDGNDLIFGDAGNDNVDGESRQRHRLPRLGRRQLQVGSGRR